MKNTKTQFEYMPYNGHPSWQLWNVNMWLASDYEIYMRVTSLIESYGVDGTVACLWEELKGQSTPDGAPYSKGAIRYALYDY